MTEEQERRLAEFNLYDVEWVGYEESQPSTPLPGGKYTAYLFLAAVLLGMVAVAWAWL